MADTKVSALAAASAAAGANEIPVNEAGTSKKVTVTQLVAYNQTLGMPIVDSLASDHSISTIAPTTTTLELIALVAGTYTFEAYLIAQSATATVSPNFNLTFTGTATANWWFDYADLSSTLLAAIGTASSVGSTAVGFGMRMANNTFATSGTAKMNNTGSANAVDAINTNILYRISGLLIVTVSGDLRLWHGSETATATTLKAGSSMYAIRTA